MKSQKKLCPYCNSIETKAYKTIGDYVIYFCSVCHLLFTGKDNKNERIFFNEEWYSDAYIFDYLKKSRELKKRFAWRVRELETLKRGGNILDLGCGIGLFLETIAETSRYNWELYGVDLNRKLIDKAKIRLKEKTNKLFLGKITSLKLEKEGFDCITCFDVLEHDDEIKLTLNEIKRVLKPSGLLLIQAPNYSSVMAGLCGERWDWWAVPDHVFHFNPQSLSLILQREGFRIKRLYTWDPFEEFISNIQGAIKAELDSSRFFSRLVSKLLYTPLLLLWVILTVVEKKLNIGSLMVITAEV